jgi:hypothetical protein
MVNEILNLAMQASVESEVAFTKFITANDTGNTGSHQYGFHLHKNSWPLFFPEEGTKGANLDLYVKIKWQNSFETDSRFIYYGVGTRNEYRLTRFGKGFPFLSDEYIGALMVLTKKADKYYEGFILSTDDEIEEFFNAFGISATETNCILPVTSIQSVETRFQLLFQEFIDGLKTDFPPTISLAENARRIFFQALKRKPEVVKLHPDKTILDWIATEFDLFKAIELNRYSELIKTPFPTVDDLIITANTLLNRRKSRAGKSLEHHLSAIFNVWNLSFTSQATTEDNKKPDFIFPDIDTYFSEPAGSNKLVFLGAKTTCKDRWRQIIGEADRIPQKHLFTLQQGISGNQMKEMKSAGVTLVVPEPYKKYYPVEHHSDIVTFNVFLQYVKYLQG